MKMMRLSSKSIPMETVQIARISDITAHKLRENPGQNYAIWEDVFKQRPRMFCLTWHPPHTIGSNFYRSIQID
jgi:hypothetical protein